MYVILCMLHNNMNVVCTHVSSSLSMYLHTVHTYVRMYIHVQACCFLHVQGEDGDVGATGSPGAEGEKVS